MPDEPLAEDDLALVDALIESVERFAVARVRSAEIDTRARIEPELLSELASLGVFGLTLPVAYGGAGLGLLAAGRLVRAMARHDRAVATTVGLHLGLGSRGLVAFGAPETQARWLPAMAEGRCIGAFAATEPGAGSDLTALATRAVPRGDGLRLDGAKVFVTNGGFAGVYTVAVSAAGLGGARRGQALVLVSRDDPGVRLGPEEHKLGLRGSSTTSLWLDGVDVPMDRVLGTHGDGARHLEHVLGWGRTVMASGCVGTALAAVHATARHTLARRQFGRPLAELPVVRAQLAGMAARAWGMQALAERASAAGDARDDATFAAASLAAKIECSEGGWDVADTAVQLHGGSGFIEETGVPLLLRDSRITRIFEGANDVLRGRLGLLEAAAPRPRPEPSGPLARRAEALAARVADVRDTLRVTHGVRLAGRPRLLHQLGSLVVLRETADAIVARAAAEPADGGMAELALARLAARLPSLLADDGEDAHVEAVAARLCSEVSP